MIPSLSLLDLRLGNKTEVCGIFGIFSIFKLKGETASSLNSIFYFSIVYSTSILSISYLVIYSFIHLFIYSFIHLFIYSFIYFKYSKYMQHLLRRRIVVDVRGGGNGWGNRGGRRVVEGGVGMR